MTLINRENNLLEDMKRSGRDPGATVMVQLAREISRAAAENTFDSMMDQIHADPNFQGHFGKVEGIGCARDQNDFPGWAREILENAKFKWDNFNLCYVRKVPDVYAGEPLMEWWLEVRAWAKASNLPQHDSLQIQVCEETDELAGMSSF